LKSNRPLAYPERMNTLAKDMMSTKLIVAKEGMSIEDAVKLLVNNKVTGLPVVDGKGCMIGILSEYDIIAAVGKSAKIDPAMFHQTVPFSREVVSVKEETTLQEILKRFIELKIRRLPVLDKTDRLVGIISRRDVMKALYYRAKLG
jgi:CBS domain-containing protein